MKTELDKEIFIVLDTFRIDTVISVGMHNVLFRKLKGGANLNAVKARDSTLFFLDQGFDNDTIEIKVNGIVCFSDIVSSSNIKTIAGSFVTYCSSNKCAVDIVFNKKRLNFYLDLSKYNVVRILHFVDDKFVVIVSNKVPGYV